jgi:hypothetical protein
MDEILWHRRESRRQIENTNIILESWEPPVYSQVTWQWLPIEREPQTAVSPPE